MRAKIIFLITIILLCLLMMKTAQAKTMAFACKVQDWDIIFSTDVDARATEVSRTYEYDDNVTVSLKIPLTQSDRAMSEVVVKEKGKTTSEHTICIMDTL